MGLASAQVGFSSDALLAVCLTELIIDTPQEEKRLHVVLLLSDCHVQTAVQSLCGSPTRTLYK